MNLEQHVTLKCVSEIYEWHKKRRAGKSHRPHLGGSQIGNDCKRALWYQFRWAWSPDFDGRMIRLFETGDLEEDRFVRELRGIGCTVWDRDPDTGKQISFTEHGGHFALSLDGVVENLPDAPKKTHTLEMKTANAKSFQDMKKKGLKASKPIYWAQCQVGMYLSNIPDCLFLMKNKDTDAIYGERVKLDVAEAISLIAKAGEVIFSATPPSRISNDPSFFGCKFCPYYAVCHGCKIPEVNCRTCAHVTPEPNGTWSCAKHGRDTTGEACADHLFIPQIMPPDLELRDTGEDWVEYFDKDTGEVFRNYGNSRDMYEGRCK
jgi:hypothetical protein